MLENIEVILGNENILFNEINNELKRGLYSYNIRLYQITNLQNLRNFLKTNQKINSLIIATDEINPHNIFPITQNIINLTNKNFSPEELKISLPFRLSSFLNQLKIIRAQYEQKPFFIINSNILFDAKKSTISWANQIYKLTEKEVDILKALIYAPDNLLEKNILLERIWGHSYTLSQTINTNTLETHISKLKQKIPIDFIVVKDNSYCLRISDLH